MGGNESKIWEAVSSSANLVSMAQKKVTIETIKQWFAEVEKHKEKVDLELFAETAYVYIPLLLKEIERLEESLLERQSTILP